MTEETGELVAVANPLKDVGHQLAIAQVLAKSNIVPRLNKQQPYNAHDLLYLMLLGKKLGIEPEIAVHSIWLVEGRPVVSARMCRALILKNGHTFRVVEWTGAKVIIEAGRKGEKPTQFETKIEEARQAGLLSRGPWQKTPKPMLMAMATRRVVDACFADMFLGMSTYDEAERDLSEADTVEPEQVEAPKKKRLTLKKIQTEEPRELVPELFTDDAKEDAVENGSN